MSATARISRRRLLQAAGAAAVAWQARPWLVAPPAQAAQTPPDDPMVVPTLEAFADTLIPGEKRFPGDRAIAGVADGPGAVQAGAVDLLFSDAAGVAPAAPAFAAGIDTRATTYAAENGIVLDPTVPPFVALDFDQRTGAAVAMLAFDAPDRQAFEACAALIFLAYHTAGHLHTAEAVRDGHPGLTAIGFPQPDADDLWRFPVFSYRRALARRHPDTTATGQPA